MKDIKNTIKTVLVVAVLLLGAGYLSAWNGPTGVPPTGNTLTPLNVSDTFQIKVGSLSLGTTTPLNPADYGNKLRFQTEGVSIFNGDTLFNGTVQIKNPSAATNKLLVSTDGNGLSTWKTVQEALDAAGYSGGSKGPHSTDYNKDWKIDKAELDRTLVLFNGGKFYKIDPTTVDGFAPSATKPAETTGYHSADWMNEAGARVPDWKIDSDELQEVQYLASSPDGYIPDPTSPYGYNRRVNVPVCAEGKYIKSLATGAWTCTDVPTAPAAPTGGDSGTHGFGAWQTGLSLDTVYKAETDGFVVAMGEYGILSLYSDSNNPPTTFIQRSYAYTGLGHEVYLTTPVRKGDYWKLSLSTGAAGGGAVNIRWLPDFGGASGSGLPTCTEGDYLKVVSGVWACAGTPTPPTPPAPTTPGTTNWILINKTAVSASNSSYASYVTNGGNGYFSFVPPTGLLRVNVSVVGGGGGTGSSWYWVGVGGGGGADAKCRQTTDVTPGSPYGIYIASGGTGGVGVVGATNPGTAGETSRWNLSGTQIASAGGQPGSSSSTGGAAGGPGGTDGGPGAQLVGGIGGGTIGGTCGLDTAGRGADGPNGGSGSGWMSGGTGNAGALRIEW